MLLQMQQNENALLAYEEVLQKSPNRFNSLYGAGLAAEKSGLIDKAVLYYKQLFSIANSNSNRPELSVARAFLSTHSPGFQLE
jgi:tetratricopeptide (TPR) repeat protein